MDFKGLPTLDTPKSSRVGNWDCPSSILRCGMIPARPVEDL